MNSNPDHAFLRHTVATLAYRCGKAVKHAPPEFAGYGGGTRPPAVILAHIGDLLDWALNMAKGNKVWQDSKPLPWNDEVARFFAALEAFDAYLASGAPLAFPAETIFQGPIADALTHTGQLTMLRRMAGCPMKSENYFMADIATGRVGPEQAAPRKEFD